MLEPGSCLRQPTQCLELQYMSCFSYKVILSVEGRWKVETWDISQDGIDFYVIVLCQKS